MGDFEDDGSVDFLKIRKSNGAKFRRVPLSTRLRREIDLTSCSCIRSRTSG